MSRMRALSLAGAGTGSDVGEEAAAGMNALSLLDERPAPAGVRDTGLAIPTVGIQTGSERRRFLL